MKKITCFIICSISILLIAQIAWAGERYQIKQTDYDKCKKLLDDPTPFFTCNENWKKWIPAEVYDKLIYEPEKMKKLWAQIVGFKAPDVVGKIATEIKPGKYTLADKEKYGFDKLMPEFYYNKFNQPGVNGPNHAGNFTEFEVVPTRQYYLSMPAAEATKNNQGKTRLDDKGYIQDETYISGYPFPRPSGPQKGWQILYNFDKNYNEMDSAIFNPRAAGVNSNFKIDHQSSGYYALVKTSGRVLPPAPWFDARAKKMKEQSILVYEALAPRDEFGNAYSLTKYTDADKANNGMVYYNMIRRIRKISASDSQDQLIGSDACYDDDSGFSQGITRSSFPFEVKILEEREYLVPALTLDGSPWFDSKEKFLYKNIKFERRPVYVLELKELDSNYIYSKRILYIDKETFSLFLTMNYDQKGRLYRTYSIFQAFLPKMGLLTWFQDMQLDFIDTHSTIEDSMGYPAPFLNRRDLSVRRLMKGK